MFKAYERELLTSPSLPRRMSPPLRQELDGQNKHGWRCVSVADLQSRSLTKVLEETLEAAPATSASDCIVRKSALRAQPQLLLNPSIAYLTSSSPSSSLSLLFVSLLSDLSWAWSGALHSLNPRHNLLSLSLQKRLERGERWEQFRRRICSC